MSKKISTNLFDFFFFLLISDTASVLGQTFSVLIIQDFEATTPNILARIIECIEGGGIIIMILPSVQTLQDIASMKMVIYFKLLFPIFTYIFLTLILSFFPSNPKSNLCNKYESYFLLLFINIMIFLTEDWKHMKNFL